MYFGAPEFAEFSMVLKSRIRFKAATITITTLIAIPISGFAKRYSLNAGVNKPTMKLTR